MKQEPLPPSKVKQIPEFQFPGPLLPLFSPKQRVCCAVLDHCREELSLSATRQVSVTVPPADTVSSEVTGCRGSSSGKNDGFHMKLMETNTNTVIIKTNNMHSFLVPSLSSLQSLDYGEIWISLFEGNNRGHHTPVLTSCQRTPRARCEASVRTTQVKAANTASTSTNWLFCQYLCHFFNIIHVNNQMEWGRQYGNEERQVENPCTRILK